MNDRSDGSVPLPEISWARLVLAGAALLLLATPLAAQFPNDAVREVDVLGTPGRVLTIGLEERTPGQPVLVLEAGGLEPIDTWGSWVLELAELAPVVAYERSGLGESPWDGASPTPEHVTERLRGLLSRIDVSPPYVLIGHSCLTVGEPRPGIGGGAPPVARDGDHRHRRDTLRLPGRASTRPRGRALGAGCGGGLPMTGLVP